MLDFFSRKRSEGFPFIVWGSGGWTLVRVVLLVSSRARRGLVVAGLLICGYWALQFSVSRACVCMDVSRGRRGGSWQCVSRACVCRDVSRGGRGTPDARGRLGGRWAVDSLGRSGESCILTLLRVLSRDRRGESRTRRAFRVAGVGNGVTCCVAGHHFAWQAQGIVHGR